MQTLVLKKDPILSNTTFELVECIEIQGNFYCDFSLLNDLSQKKDFLKIYSDSMHQELQMFYSRDAHNIAEYKEEIDKAIDSSNFGDSFVINISDLISQHSEPTYNYYNKLVFTETPFTLESESIAIDDLPIGFLEVTNYFSYTFLHALKSHYGNVDIQFAIIKNNLKESILALKVSGNNHTGYYNLSYKKPYKGIALI